MTVTADTSLEGDVAGPPRSVRFTLTHSPAVAMPTTWEFVTCPDSARESMDYVGLRGSVTIAANETSALVEVPLAADAWKESPESFALVVWPRGGATHPVLTEIPKPVLGFPEDKPFRWPDGAVGVGDDTFFIGTALGVVTGGIGQYERRLALPEGGLATTVSVGGGGRWMAAVDAAGLGHPAGYGLTRFHVADRLASRLDPLGWAGTISLPGLVDSARSVRVQGDVAGIVSHGALRFHQLNAVGPTRLMGQCPLPDARRVSYDGRLVAASNHNTSLGIQIFEADGPELARWRLIKVLPGTHELAALGGNILVLRRDVAGGSPQTFFHIHERDAGGPNNWGETVVFTVNDAEGPRPLGEVVLAGSLLMVGDPAADLGAGPRPGRVHQFVKDGSGPTWQSLGSFTAPNPLPGDGFGGRLAAGGTHLLVTSATGSSNAPNTAWLGLMPGARALILDDDHPVVHVSEATEFEPHDGPLAMGGWLWLSHASSDDLTVTWRAVGLSAQAGHDFVAAEASTIIPAGALAVPITVTLLPDRVAEMDETLRIEITSVAGGEVSAGPLVRWTIRDTDPAPVVFAGPSDVYEGLSQIQPEVRLYPADGPLSVPWDVRAIPLAPEGRPQRVGGFAQAGSDFTPASGTLTADETAFPRLALTTLRDGTEEPYEVATVALALDPLVAAAGYGTRRVDSVTGLSPGTTYSEHATTDGDRVAVMTIVPNGTPQGMKVVHVYIRDAAAPGGWRYDRVLRLADFGIPDASGLDFLKLRRGRLCYYHPTAGRAWILAQDSTAGGDWKLEASFAARHAGNGGFQPNAAFDGEAFVTARQFGAAGSQIHFHERGTGDWGFHQDLQIEGTIGDIRLDGTSLKAWVQNTLPSRPSILLVERAGSGASPWVRRGDILVQTGFLISSSPFLTRGDVIICGRSPNHSLVLRRRDGGRWGFEQELETAAISLDRGVLLGWNGPQGNDVGVSRTFIDTGAALQPWQLMPLSDPQFPPSYAVPGGTVYDHHARVIVGSTMLAHPSSGGPPVPGHYIAEPGADFRIIDSESFVIQVNQIGYGEGYNTETYPEVRLQTVHPTLIEISIPFRTVAGGTAVPNVDFRPVNGTLTLSSTRQEAGLLVPVIPDGILEPEETVLIELGPPSFGRIQTSPFSLSIPPQLPEWAALRSPLIFEPVSGQQTFILPFRIEHGFIGPVTCHYAISGLTATEADVVLGTGTVVIPDRSTALPIPLTVLADTLSEGPETVRVTITALDNVPVNLGNSLLTIHDRPTPGGTADAYTVPSNGVLEFSPARSVLANDSPGFGAVEQARAPESGDVSWRPDGTFRYQPSRNFVGINRFAYRGTLVGESLLTGTATWRWLHPLNGQDPETIVPGFQANWMKPGFDDAAWATGTGLMGYGTIGEGAGEPLTTSIGQPPLNNRYTAYFRTEFTAPPSPTPGLIIRFACDDAAIFYLNGTEVARYVKEPDPAFLAAPDTYQLLSANLHDFGEETEVRTLILPTAQAVPGANVLAVSVHNQLPTSSDLGFKCVEVSTGYTSHPILVEVDVTDPGTVPFLIDDARTAPSTTTPLDSVFLASGFVGYPAGSLYRLNLHLSAAGLPVDPILEAETGGSPVGPVAFDHVTGHFRIDGPPGFFGDTSFTYRVRDKDGWSNTATVTVTVPPSRAFDVWRQARFGGGSVNQASSALADVDGDSLPNLIEFAFGTDPTAPTIAPLLVLDRSEGRWVAEFNAQKGFGADAFIDLESSPNMASTPWTRLARLNDAFEFMEILAPGVFKYTRDMLGNQTRYSIYLPPSLDAAGFLRLRVSQERHAMDP